MSAKGMAKHDQDYNALSAESYLYGGNAPFIEDLYQCYLEDPEQVDPQWQAYFSQLRDGVEEPDHKEVRQRFAQHLQEPCAAIAAEAQAGSATSADKQVAVLQLINSYRFRGHQRARIDPLGLQGQTPISELDPSFHGLTEADMDQVFSTGSLVAMERAPLRQVLVLLQETYCGRVGAEYMHITDTAQKRWIQHQLEAVRSQPSFAPEFRRRILERIVAAESFEQYLHTKYVGQKRFSLEGADSVIPLLDDLVSRAGDYGVEEMVMGMAHRGRLNVLVNVLGKSPAELFQEFEGVCDPAVQPCGDVKYHQGFSTDVETPGGNVHLALAFNPSHLEIIDPVVEGSVRARQDRRGDNGGDQVLPVLFHGDAAFSGQGVVMETINMSQARGFTTHGTVHVLINNQIGFTTSNPLDTRSTLYASEVARLVQAPIFHVNGDDPEAVVFVTQLALDFRMRFKRDVVVDLVCFRRHGHSEADEPAVTQPRMYKAIRHHPPVRQLYAEGLVGEGVIGEDDVEAMASEYRQALDEGRSVARGIVSRQSDPYAVDWSYYFGGHWDDPVSTGVAMDRLRALGEQLGRVPEGFHLHPRVAKILAGRQQMAAGELAMDWGFAEHLAYATLVVDGYPVRLSGQDSSRGTFFHRHAVVHDQEDGHTYTPLRNLAGDQAPFEIYDSLLSEEGVVGFEYGYATATPEGLVIWEAQFGDFVNNAQVLVDQFMSSGEVKWGRLCGLTLFLPHGYDGQGPEHSSARPERFLQLCAGDNMQVCVPSTPAQMFHMLRRQVLRPYRKPLVVMTPKSLLRHRLSTSNLAELAEGGFQTVIDEVDKLAVSKVTQVILCSGKVYYELLEARRRQQRQDIAIIRVEQLYPFPEAALKQVLGRYRQVRELVWCQEEPENQGAWEHMRHRLEALKRSQQGLRYAGRPPYAAPAEGHLALHLERQQAVIDEALGTANDTARSQ